MSLALVISVRFYENLYHGAGGWPPAPARLFQALLSGSACGATIPDRTLDALEWLERLRAPIVAAPCSVLGSGWTNYVPNNDLDARLSKRKPPSMAEAVAAIRTPKKVRPVLLESEPPLLYVWFFDGAGAQAGEVCQAAHDLLWLGWGIDQAWGEAHVTDSADTETRLFEYDGVVYCPSEGGGDRAFLCPQPGSLRSLTDRYSATLNRFPIGGTNRKPTRAFVQPPRPHFGLVVYDAPPRRMVFALRAGDARSSFAPWPLAGAARLVERVRDAAAGRLRNRMADRRGEIERYLIGRGATDRDKARRVRIVPVPSVGHSHADMAIRRLAVDVPQACPMRFDDLHWAFAQEVWTDEDGAILRELQRAGDDDSMIRAFTGPARLWRSVTPLALPVGRGSSRTGTARRNREAAAAGAVRRALRHAGVRAAPFAIRVRREPFDAHGERAEAFADGTRFSEAALWHAEIGFAAPVAGPLLLGDGRYLGLGLMRPEADIDGVVAFEIEAGLADGAPIPWRSPAPPGGR